MRRPPQGQRRQILERRPARGGPQLPERHRSADRVTDLGIDQVGRPQVQRLAEQPGPSLLGRLATGEIGDQHRRVDDGHAQASRISRSASTMVAERTPDAPRAVTRASISASDGLAAAATRSCLT